MDASPESFIDCKIALGPDDSPRCDFERHPGWAFFACELGTPWKRDAASCYSEQDLDRITTLIAADAK